MIQYRDWYIWTQGQVVARQFDHMTRSLEVVGELPEGWDWTVIVRVGEYMDYLPLTRTQTGASITLTAQQLALPGMYSIQLRGKQGELVRHTNVLSVYVPASLSGDAHWPEIPSEFTRLEQRVLAVGEQAANTARQAEAAAAEITAATEHFDQMAGDALDTIDQARQDAGNAATAAGESAAGAAASEQVAEAAAVLAGSYSSHPPVIGANGNWWAWDGAQYADSGRPSQGELTRTQANTFYSNALKGATSGAAVRVDDVSPLEHAMTVKVSSKNLIPYPYQEYNPNRNGISYTVNADRTITANGTATADSSYLCVVPSTPLPVKAGTYVLSGCPTGGHSGQTFSVYLAWRKNTGDARMLYTDVGDGKAVTFTEDGFVDIGIDVRSGYVADNLVFKPQLEAGMTATEYTPYADDLTAAALTVCGKNIIPFPYKNVPASGNGLTIQTDTDGTITVNGTATGYVFLKPATSLYLPKGSYFMSGVPKGGGGDTYRMYIDGNIKDTGNGCAFTLTEDKTVDIQILLYPNILFENLVFRPQIEVGNGTTGFEAYKATTCIPSVDGTVEGITGNGAVMTLLADNSGVVIRCEYNRDINKAFEQLQQAIISMGGNV